MDLDDFGDDDLDALPDNTLRALEENALASTQRPNITAAKRPAHQAHSHSAVGQQPSWRAPQQAQHASKNTAPPPEAPDLPSSDYGFEDEDVIDLNEAEAPQLPTKNGIPSRPSLASRPNLLHANNHHQQQRQQQQQQQRASRPPLDPETEAAFAAADAELGSHRPGQWSEAAAGAAASHSMDHDTTNDKGGNINALQARIAELESEQHILREAATQFRDAMLSKQGEISIVRANQDKAAKEYERRIAIMQKLHADEAAKSKAELDAGRKEREKMETDNRFLQHDLRQEAERSKRLTGPAGGGAGAGGVGKMRSAVNGVNGQGKAATPQKAKRQHTLGDGFEDTEVLRISPSKNNNNNNRDNSAEHTPKTGSKRKRAAQDSPAAVLSFSPASAPTQKVNGEHSQQSLPRSDSDYGHAQDDRYESMVRMMNHIPNGKDRRSVEALSQFAFPSSPDVTLAAILIKGVSAISLQSTEDHFAIKASRALLSIWRGCLSHKYYSPLPLVLDLLRSVLRLELPSTVATLIEEAVPLCTETICLVAVPTAGVFSANPAFAASVGQKVSAELKTWVDVDEMMDFLQDLSDAASVSPERAETFWRTMEFHFTMLMLNKAQPLYQILTGLKILSASAFESTFGSIAAQAEEQMMHERGTIDRLMNLLSEIPQVPDGEPAYTAEEIAELRIEVLAVLKTLCLTPHGGEVLARHVTAIGRILSFLDSQVRSLYTIRPSIGLATDSPLPAAGNENRQQQQPRAPPVVAPLLHDLVAQTINTTILLLHHLLRTHNDIISFPAKTSAVKGGHHRFIVAMTRIAFSDQLVFEAGISDAAVEAAHSILDEILNPEEGEAVMMAVETPRGTRSSSAITTNHDQHQQKGKGDGTHEDGEEDAEMLDAG